MQVQKYTQKNKKYTNTHGHTNQNKYTKDKLIKKILNREFLKTAWMKDDKQQKAPYILLITRRFNEVGRSCHALSLAGIRDVALLCAGRSFDSFICLSSIFYLFICLVFCLLVSLSQSSLSFIPFFVSLTPRQCKVFFIIFLILFHYNE